MYEKNLIYENIGRATKAKRKKMKYLHIDVEHKQILSPQWNPENVSDEKNEHDFLFELKIPSRY